MLHIKDIEAFARINEALARQPAPEPRRPMAAELAVELAAEPAPELTVEPTEEDVLVEDTPSVDAIPLATAEVLPFPTRRSAREDDAADSIGRFGYDFDFAPRRPVTMVGLLSRMFFRR